MKVFVLTDFEKRKRPLVKCQWSLIDSNEMKLNFVVEECESLLKPDLKLKVPKERRRKNRLWESNCFEFFWSVDDQRYFELNLSPFGDWQIYEFESYRKQSSNLPTEFSIDGVSLSKDKSSFSIEWTIQSSRNFWHQLKKIHPTAVLLSEGSPMYFAPAHPEDKPDFHKMDFWFKTALETL